MVLCRPGLGLEGVEWVLESWQGEVGIGFESAASWFCPALICSLNCTDYLLMCQETMPSRREHVRLMLNDESNWCAAFNSHFHSAFASEIITAAEKLQDTQYAMSFGSS